MDFLRVQAVYCKAGVSDGRKLEVGGSRRISWRRTICFQMKRFAERSWLLQYFQQWKLDYRAQSISCGHYIAIVNKVKARKEVAAFKILMI